MRHFLTQLWYKISPPPIPPGADKSLTTKSDYYKQLSRDDQHKFLQRLAILLKFMDFIPNGIPKVTSEMKIIIGSAIIQITFGFDKFLFKHFRTVYIMPERYVFRNSDEPFLGHVDFQQRVICFSWVDVQAGFDVPDDAINVALHEMAHVWEMEHRLSEDFQDIFIEKDWKHWQEKAVVVMAEIRNGQHQFLKEYGGKNMKEMFAVCVEAFFEQPKAFKENEPELYQRMVKLLRQDPMNGAR